jgi:light-regulated signal transduction histidine kinase (bacteriophytochrome)
MSKLIDVLLKFSHLSHAKIKQETVDLSQVAKIVVAELRLTEPQRQVTCTITEGLQGR